MPDKELREPEVLTVSQLNARVRLTLESGFQALWVAGEVSNLKIAASGHVYLTLKDSSAEVSAVMWRPIADRLRFELTDGLDVLVCADVTLYEARGRYQVLIRKIEPRGVGALQLAFRQLVDKLGKEGLFDPARKRPLPRFPRHVGIVTSPTGAAIRDILRQLTRWPLLDVTIFPVRVQGEGAAREIASAIDELNRIGGFDVLIVGRGGGSLEDLWSFNEEVVARAIFASEIPVVSAVGHEVDVTISDMVADVRALTPTAAGEMVVPDLAQVREDLASLAKRLVSSLDNQARLACAHLRALGERLSPQRLLARLQQFSQRADEILFRLTSRSLSRLRERRLKLDAAAGRLESLSPLSVLRRGYCITTILPDDQPVRDASVLRPGDTVKTRLAAGSFTSKVERTDQPDTIGGQ
jgi:exodeoxyribonuclease VII large subunit